MSPTRTVRHAILVLAALSVSACGVAQAIHDGTVNVAKRTFTTPIPTMNLDVVNQASDNSGPAIVRIYQLTSSQAFEALTDAQWLTNDLSTLKADLLATSNLVVPPGAGRSLRPPMHQQTQYVGMVALGHDDDRKPMWLLIPRKQWAKTQLVQIDLDRDTLRLHPAM
ncbi:type VI secretion system lipoprotein TssJ [Dyella sp.]|uniref:type VI secretion system lipoprotein TssJ n=1 Tax=Dyella sp. TaxID=1869338 RepID=UPI002D78EF82|nr:type VI secretion system lipoprotein TssJ [Dyella sp.]HET7329363.1 type VI secretion system lipoprotein TssJ [Dyella sp.]